MRVLYERCAAVDVGKDVIAVAVRLPGDGPGGRQMIKRAFKTYYGVLREAARWLTSPGVTHVAMEATGIYSMPVCHALAGHGESGQVLVCNAGHVKNVPGRKTDLADAGWLVPLLECGLLRGSFIPPADIKAARDVIRYRAKVAQSRTSEVQRLGNVLQDAQLTELRGGIAVSGRPAPMRAARFPAHDQRRGWRAGSVLAEGAALRGA
jgi:transposase